MNDKNKYIRISEDMLESIRIYSEVENKSMSEFADDLLKDALSEYFLKRSGGAVMTLPNPQIESPNESNYKKAIYDLGVLVTKLYPLNVSLFTPLNNLLVFYSQRLFYDLPEDKEKFMNNMVVDSTQSDSIANNTKV